MEDLDIHGTELGNFLYLDRASLRPGVKPYRLRGKREKNTPRANISDELKTGITVRDLRGNENLDFDLHGFTWTRLKTKLPMGDFYNTFKVEQIYYPEIRQLLQKMFQPQRIEFVEHKTRRDREVDPATVSKRARKKFWRRPIKVVHLDYSIKTAEDVCTDLLKIPLGQYRRMQCLTLWQPLHRPATDCPLALCDPQTVDFNTDAIPIDVVSQKMTTECTQFYFDSSHKWYFLSNQVQSEITIFRQYDSTLPNGQGVPHAAFHIESNRGVAPPRESIETRVFLFYD